MPKTPYEIIRMTHPKPRTRLDLLKELLRQRAYTVEELMEILDLSEWRLRQLLKRIPGLKKYRYRGRVYFVIE